MSKRKTLECSLRMDIRATDDRKHSFVISDSTIDRHGTIIPIEAWDLSNYMKNGIVAYQHETGGWNNNPDTIIGKGRVWIEDDVLIGEVEYEPEELNPLAEKIRQKVEFGTLRAASVGFVPLDGHWGNERKGEDPDIFYFDHVELVEFSIVNIPSNPNALKRSYEEFKTERLPQPPIPEANDQLTKARAWFWLHKLKNHTK